jgi:23S rRNA pseudouridine1911/1915/1917 synthase
MKIKITIDNSKKRLDKFLTEKLENLSRSQIQKQIKNNLIFVNGKQVPVHYFLKENDVIEIQTNKRKKEKDKGSSLVKKIKVIDETNEYLVVEKPSGLLTHPDNIHNETTLLDWVIQKYPEIKNIKAEKNRPGIVHRLDRDVSGLLVVAKNQKTFDHLKKQFKTRKVQKIYQTLVHGEVEPHEGIIDRSIIRSQKTGIMIAKSTADRKAKPSITEFEVLKRYKNYTLLKINLKTGRTHQIRVHLKSIGHSIVGDALYKTKDIKETFKRLQRTENKKNRLDLDRIFLCSTELSFNDLNKDLKEFKTKLPLKLSSTLKNLQPLT